jgi:hypothetical protein
MLKKLDPPNPHQNNSKKSSGGEINQALAMPIRRDDDPLSYIPTQILSELFKISGADGIAYKSSVRNGGHNLALFDLAAADLVGGRLYTVDAISYSFSKAGSTWWKRRSEDS